MCGREEERMKAESQRASSKILSSVIILSLQTFVTPHVCADYQVRRNLGTGNRMDLSSFSKRMATVGVLK
jgi:hypothetical protein